MITRPIETTLIYNACDPQTKIQALEFLPLYPKYGTQKTAI
jgi:hypothetical protein